MNLEPCPMCGAALTFPDAPVRDQRGPDADGRMRTVIVDIPCPNCPATVTVFEATGWLCCFKPNRSIRVRRAQ